MVWAISFCFMGDTSVKIVWRKSVKQLSTTQLKLSQLWPNLALPIQRDTAREKVVDRTQRLEVDVFLALRRFE